MIALSFLSVNEWPAFWLLYGSPDASGVRQLCSFTSLIRNLRASRKLVDNRDAVMAKAVFEESFDLHFSTVRRGKQEVLTRETDIARRYRELRNFPTWWDELDIE